MLKECDIWNGRCDPTHRWEICFSQQRQLEKDVLMLLLWEAQYIATKAHLSRGQEVVMHVGNDNSDSDNSSDITSQYFQRLQCLVQW